MPRFRNTFGGKGTYRAYEIGFNGETEKFYCDALGLTDDKLSGLHKQIDNAIKHENKLNTQALYLTSDGWSDNREWQVETVLVTTTVAPRYHGQEETWIKRSNGDSEKVSVSDLYPMSELEAIKKWLAMWSQVTALKQDADNFHKRLKPFDLAKLKATAKSEGKP